MRTLAASAAATSGEPSRTWVVAEQPSLLLVVRWADYAALLDTAPGWQRFARVIAETLYRRKVEREYELLALDAAERYRRTLLRWPTRSPVGTRLSCSTTASTCCRRWTT